ncbi:MAG: peptide chain release factor-like protein [Gemmatimonadetes bacterium]|nr:peptide chain release factor-like protein [Gemmatimonadota bacterium]
MTVDAKTESRDRLLAECRVDTFRSGGKGGQHQNKVESGVRLTHRPTGISVASRAHRSQHGNRREALRRLREKLAELAREDPPRIQTQVPAHERQRRIEEKNRRSRLKRMRARPPLEE